MLEIFHLLLKSQWKFCLFSFVFCFFNSHLIDKSTGCMHFRKTFIVNLNIRQLNCRAETKRDRISSEQLWCPLSTPDANCHSIQARGLRHKVYDLKLQTENVYFKQGKVKMSYLQKTLEHHLRWRWHTQINYFISTTKLWLASVQLRRKFLLKKKLLT